MISIRRTGMVLGILLAAAVPQVSAQVKLELKFPEGTKERIEQSTKLDQTTTVMGMDIDTNVEQAQTTVITVGKKRDDGAIPIEKKVESIKATISTPMGVISFDSANPEATKSDQPQFKAAVEAMKARVGTSYTIVLGKDGKVSAIEGLEALLEKLQEASPEAGDQFKASLNADSVKRNESQELERFPDSLLRKGETWSKTEVQDLGGGQTLTYERTYEYQGTTEQGGKTLDKIGMKTTAVKFNLMPNSPIPIKVTNSDFKVSKSEGTILFDREAGRVVETHDETKLSGNITLEAMGQEIEMKLDLSINTTTKSTKA